jgi:hypothetical protein
LHFVFAEKALNSRKRNKSFKKRGKMLDYLNNNQMKALEIIQFKKTKKDKFDVREESKT